MLMTEENLLTGAIDKFNIATEYGKVNSDLGKTKFIPWEYSLEGKKLKEKYQFDYSGNQVSIIVNQLSTIFTNMDKKELADAFRGIILNYIISNYSPKVTPKRL